MFLGVYEGKFWILKLRLPRKSIPTGTHRLTQKRWRYSQKCVLQSCARDHKKKHLKLKMIFHPFAGRGALRADFHGFWHVGSDPGRNHACHILNRSIQGFWGYGCQNRRFPIDFDSRPYNSATINCSSLFIVWREVVRCCA